MQSDFPNVTVLFADLVGFTQYCSGREPKDVFLLLESLFREFDAAAKRQGKYLPHSYSGLIS